MKIEDKREERKDLQFHELYVGDTFEYDEELWVKIDDDRAFSLTDEWIDSFGDRTAILKVNVKIVIED